MAIVKEMLKAIQSKLMELTIGQLTAGKKEHNYTINDLVPSNKSRLTQRAADLVVGRAKKLSPSESIFRFDGRFSHPPQLTHTVSPQTSVMNKEKALSSL